MSFVPPSAPDLRLVPCVGCGKQVSRQHLVEAQPVFSKSGLSYFPCHAWCTTALRDAPAERDACLACGEQIPERVVQAGFETLHSLLVNHTGSHGPIAFRYLQSDAADRKAGFRARSLGDLFAPIHQACVADARRAALAD